MINPCIPQAHSLSHYQITLVWRLRQRGSQKIHLKIFVEAFGVDLKAHLDGIYETNTG